MAILSLYVLYFIVRCFYNLNRSSYDIILNKIRWEYAQQPWIRALSNQGSVFGGRCQNSECWFIIRHYRYKRLPHLSPPNLDYFVFSVRILTLSPGVALKCEITSYNVRKQHEICPRKISVDIWIVLECIIVCIKPIVTVLINQNK